MTVKFHWSNCVKIITTLTLLFVVIIPVVLAIGIYIDSCNLLLAIIIALSVGLVTSLIIGACAWWAYGMMPLSMSIRSGNIAGGSGEIVVRQGRGRSIVIPLESIVSIEALPREKVRGLFNIRTYGSGGLFGWMGQFYNKKLGHYEMYATELKNLIIIKTVKKTYVFSCTEREEFLQRVKDLATALKD